MTILISKDGDEQAKGFVTMWNNTHIAVRFGGRDRPCFAAHGLLGRCYNTGSDVEEDKWEVRTPSTEDDFKKVWDDLRWCNAHKGASTHMKYKILDAIASSPEELGVMRFIKQYSFCGFPDICPIWDGAQDAFLENHVEPAIKRLYGVESRDKKARDEEYEKKRAERRAERQKTLNTWVEEQAKAAKAKAKAKAKARAEIEARQKFNPEMALAFQRAGF